MERLSTAGVPETQERQLLSEVFPEPTEKRRNGGTLVGYSG
jgi:hypothetical protein